MENLKKKGGLGQIEEVHWRRVIKSMYDQNDSQTLIQKLHDIYHHKMEEKENEFNANYIAKQVPHPGTINRSLLNYTMNSTFNTFNQV